MNIVDKVFPFAGDKCVYVKTYRWSLRRPKQARLAFWKNRKEFLVTPSDTGDLAGFYINDLTRGHFGFIKISGKVDFE